MNLHRINTITHKALCIIASVFLLLVAVGLIMMHLFLRSAIGVILAIIIAFRVKQPASVKAWVITIVLIIVGLAFEDFDPEVISTGHYSTTLV